MDDDSTAAFVFWLAALDSSEVRVNEIPPTTETKSSSEALALDLSQKVPVLHAHSRINATSILLARCPQQLCPDGMTLSMT